MMPQDPYYKSAAWRKLRAAALERDRHTCTVPGCGQPAKVVDHIRSRRAGGADTLANLRCLCRAHDQQVKEGAGGQRKGGGRLTVVGCDADGRPRDPAHPWLKPKAASAPSGDGGGAISGKARGADRTGPAFAPATKSGGGVTPANDLAPTLTVIAGPGADIEEPDWQFLIPDREDGRHEAMRRMAEREWRRVTAELRDSQTLAPVNRHSVQRLVLAYVRYDLAAAMTMQEGAVVASPKTKVPQLSLWQVEMRAADADATSQEMELCLNPRRRGSATKALKKTKRATAADSYLGAAAR